MNMAHACRWLLAHCRTEEGECVLKGLVQGPEMERMLSDIRAEAEFQRKQPKVALSRAIATPELRRQLHIGRVLP